MRAASRPTGWRAEPIDVLVSASVRLPLARAGVARLVRAVLRAEGIRQAFLSVTFVGEMRIRSLNRAHLGRDRVTDVIAFPLGKGSPLTVGDVYIAPRVAARAARRFNASLKDELRRLVVHGVLHALGYDHPEGGSRTASAMWRRQERYVSRFGRLAG